MSEQQYLVHAREVLAIEADALRALSDSLDGSFSRACEAVLACEGRVVVSGIGKSGHIGRKIAATLASTGTPAFFVHPAEAAHGDLGMIVDGDVVLAISNSGERDEIAVILPALKRKNITLIGMTGRPESTLARHADIHLTVAVPQEACPLGLAPTSSTTAALALGDALAVALLRARAFTPDDFALSHPAGSLGKRLLLQVADVMHSGDELPVVYRRRFAPPVPATARSLRPHRPSCDGGASENHHAESAGYRGAENHAAKPRERLAGVR